MSQKLTPLDKVLLFACVVILPQAKSVYFPLVFLVLFIPKDHWSSRLRYWLWAGFALFFSLLGFGAWSVITTDVAASNGLVRGDNVWQYGYAKLQQQFIIHHPIGFLHAVVNSFMYQSKFYMDTYFGWLGFTYQQIPGMAEVAGFLAIGLSILIIGRVKFKKYVPTMLLGALAAVTLVMFVVFYVAYTPLQNYLVEGVQGRYFIPVTMLSVATVAAFFPNLRIKDEGADTAKVILVALIALCLLLSVMRYGLAIA